MTMRGMKDGPNVQMHMFQEALRGFRKPAKEGVYRFVYIVIVFICDCDVEKPVEEFAVDTPGFSVGHQSEGPGDSHPEINRRILLQ
jgi:hypothetical protein